MGNPNKRIWEIRQQADLSQLDLYIYSDVEEDSYGFFGDLQQSETSARHFREALASQPDVRQINVYINSRGGSVFEGTAIYNQLKRHTARKTVYVDGFACSVASVIAMAGDEVVMPRNTMMMLHNMWMFAVGNAEELRKAADDLDAINRAGREAYLSKANGKLDADALRAMMDAETWLSAEDCVRYGLADRFAEEEADAGASAEMGARQSAFLNRAGRGAFLKSVAACARGMDGPPAAPPVPEPPARQEQKELNKILQLFKQKGEL